MQFAPISLKDNGGIEHVFAPRDITQGVATFVESTGVPIADRRVSVSTKRTAENGRTKVNIKFVLPVVQDATVNGITRPTLVRTAYADLTVTYDSTSNASERGDVRVMLSDFLTEEIGIQLLNGLATLY